MSLDPLLAAPAAIQFHAFAAAGAFVLGLVQFVGATLRHRTIGYVWVVLMVVVALSSFWIHQIDQWRGFSLIHLIPVYTLAVLPLAVLAARRHHERSHRAAMIGLFLGALVIAGALTLLPGRIMAGVLLGR
jgi:uncharacterized membrane protein